LQQQNTTFTQEGLMNEKVEKKKGNVRQAIEISLVGMIVSGIVALASIGGSPIFLPVISAAFDWYLNGIAVFCGTLGVLGVVRQLGPDGDRLLFTQFVLLAAMGVAFSKQNPWAVVVVVLGAVAVPFVESISAKS